MLDNPDEVTDKYVSARRLQMWLYEVNHGQLVLRSVKGVAQTTRVDILFKNVHVVHLPTVMDGLSITRSDDGFVMAGSNWHGHVQAGACFVAEDEGEYFDPTLDWGTHEICAQKPTGRAFRSPATTSSTPSSSSTRA